MKRETEREKERERERTTEVKERPRDGIKAQYSFWIRQIETQRRIQRASQNTNERQTTRQQRQADTERTSLNKLTTQTNKHAQQV